MWSLVEAAPACLAIDALCKFGRDLVGVAAGGALDSSRVGDRSGVAYGRPFLVAALSAPDSHQFDLAGLGTAVGLLALTPLQLGGAHRHARAVHAQVHRRRTGW